MSDLTFIDEGNPKLMGEHKLVNFRKKQLEYDVIIQVLKYQDRAYQFKLVIILYFFFFYLNRGSCSQFIIAGASIQINI